MKSFPVSLCLLSVQEESYVYILLTVYNFTKHSHSLQLVKNNNKPTALVHGRYRVEGSRLCHSSLYCTWEGRLGEWCEIVAWSLFVAEDSRLFAARRWYILHRGVELERRMCSSRRGCIGKPVKCSGRIANPSRLCNMNTGWRRKEREQWIE